MMYMYMGLDVRIWSNNSIQHIEKFSNLYKNIALVHTLNLEFPLCKVNIPGIACTMYIV